MEVRIGIKTKGEPKIRVENGMNILDNMLIGDNFHWERTITACLPGKVEYLPFTSKDKNISIVNSLPLETYLECVVGSEMNAAAPLEFLKAHVIISRNWIAGKIMGSHLSGKEGSRNEEGILIGWDDTGDHEGFHVCSDDHCQRYQGLQEISPEAKEAIHSTEHQVLLDSKGNLIDTRFSKCCGGLTELFSTCWQNKDYESLRSIRDPWCDLSHLDAPERDKIIGSVLKDYDKDTQNYGFRWQTEISKEAIKKNLKSSFHRDIGNIKSIEILHRGPSGRADLIKIKGSVSDLKLGKELWIRRLLSDSHLYSSLFEITDKDSKIILEGKGWGHGVGLCQIGAANMALHGYDCNTILSFYYPGSKLSTLTDFGL